MVARLSAPRTEAGVCDTGGARGSTCADADGATSAFPVPHSRPGCIRKWTVTPSTGGGRLTWPAGSNPHADTGPSTRAFGSRSRTQPRRRRSRRSTTTSHPASSDSPPRSLPGKAREARARQDARRSTERCELFEHDAELRGERRLVVRRVRSCRRGENVFGRPSRFRATASRRCWSESSLACRPAGTRPSRDRFPRGRRPYTDDERQEATAGPSLSGSSS